MSLKKPKYTSFRDIPPFTRSASYKICLPLPRASIWLNEMRKDYGLNILPDFQRGRVWTDEQQIAYIVFLLRGGRTGRDLFFNKPSWDTNVPEGDYDEFVCVDGLQRLTAMCRFVNNEIPAFGSYFEEYTDLRLFNRIVAQVHINDLKTEREVLQWYLDINDGGTPHTSDEIERVRKLLEQCR